VSFSALGYRLLERQRPKEDRRSDKKARDIMSDDCTCIGENDTVLEAAKRLAELDVGSMPICGEDDRLKRLRSISRSAAACLARTNTRRPDESRNVVSPEVDHDAREASIQAPRHRRLNLLGRVDVDLAVGLDPNRLTPRPDVTPERKPRPVNILHGRVVTPPLDRSLKPRCSAR
jgi:CBS domain-containing protein